MNEYFVVGHTFAAPFFSETVEDFIEAQTPEDAALVLVERYKDHVGIYALAVYKDANDYHKGKKPVIKWQSNDAQLTAKIKSGTIYKDKPGHVQINGEWHTVDNPKEGAFV